MLIVVAIMPEVIQSCFLVVLSQWFPNCLKFYLGSNYREIDIKIDRLYGALGVNIEERSSVFTLVHFYVYPCEIKNVSLNIIFLIFHIVSLWTLHWKRKKILGNPFVSFLFFALSALLQNKVDLCEWTSHLINDCSSIFFLSSNS